MSSDSPKSLPLEMAYEFAKENKLAEKLQKIESYQSDALSSKQTRIVKKGLLVKLFEQSGIYSDFLDKYWQHGKTNDGQSRRLYCIKFAEEHFSDDVEEDLELSEKEEVKQTFEFALESHLRDFLSNGNNISQIEQGLKICNINGKAGIEFSIDDGKGRIDILTTDENGKYVIIELKRRKGKRQVIGQILYYMAWVDNFMEKASTPCRGIIIANEVSEDIKLAISLLDRVKVVKYNMNFTIENL